MATKGRSIELFFHDGDPDGMTTATIPFQWTGHVLVTNRTEVFVALQEPETRQPGIYLLIGEKDGESTLYVGETDEIRGRINQHIKGGQKDWWERAVFVTAIGDPLNKAHARYLESRIYTLAKDIGRIKLENVQEPTESPMSKASKAHMEDFLHNLRLVLPALRFDFLTEQRKVQASIQNAPNLVEVTRFVLTTKEVSARARKEGSEFIVEANSDARSDWVGTTTINSTYGVLYRDLVEQGVIVDGGNGKRRFVQDYAFNSVSAAASVVTGRPTSGPLHWHLATNTDISYADYERSIADRNAVEEQSVEAAV